MSDIRVASRYAKSLLGLAHEKGVLEEVKNDMKLFEGVVNQSREFVLLLKNPIINHDKKLNVLNSLFNKRVNTLTLEFFKIITKKNRESVLPAIATEFGHQYNVFKNIEEATVTTTFPLTAELRAHFVRVIEEAIGKTVEITEVVDKNLLGGFIVKVGDRQIDESISSKLAALRLRFSENPYEKAY